MKNYKVLIHSIAFEKAKTYLALLKSGKSAGEKLRLSLKGLNLDDLLIEEFIEILMNTKEPQIFAESAVWGNGLDWNLEELSILGDISIATSVMTYDTGKHYAPVTHEKPFASTLLFTPGALLRNGNNHLPVDWNEVVTNNELNFEGYYSLYERRLFPVFAYINQVCQQKNTQALITIPGLGCGQFAGPFSMQLGIKLQNVLIRLLENHGKKFPCIKAVYYDPYNECSNERYEIHDTSLMVRPLTKGNEQKSQLCHPNDYAEDRDDFGDCELFSIVAWDHVSWPGNDFFIGSRSTDDGVKAAATSSMNSMTGIDGVYNEKSNCYNPPALYKLWAQVVAEKKLTLEIQDNLLVLP